MVKDKKPFVITYVSPNGSRGTFYKPDLKSAIDKIADLTLAPHQFRVLRTTEHGYLVAAMQDPHSNF